TLRYLATGRSYADLKFSAIISPQALSEIIPETCWAIYRKLKNKYMKFPKSEQEWQRIADDFSNTWQFPNCCGAIDGKHISIVKPPNSGSYYYNYKGRFSVILFAIANANYEFVMVHTGTNGKVSDGGILNSIGFYDKLESKTLKLPQPSTPEGCDYSLPFTFISDETFTLMENLMKPYADRNLTKEEKIFNYRLSRARRVVENAFGIMASRFRVFRTEINLSLENIDHVVLACCVLHNYLISNASDTYLQPSIDREDTATNRIHPGEWREESEAFIPLHRTPRGSAVPAKTARERYTYFFNHEGRVGFQDNMILHNSNE
ncbi:unnamed protein product, partial [Callosobruchus maculatus]